MTGPRDKPSERGVRDGESPQDEQSPSPTPPPSKEGGMIGEGGEKPVPEDREGGMIGEG
jgi:hypothetical protein